MARPSQRACRRLQCWQIGLAPWPQCRLIGGSNLQAEGFMPGACHNLQAGRQPLKGGGHWQG